MIEVTHIKPDEPFVDIMGGDLRREVSVLDKGFVALLDCMPRLVPPGQTCDFAAAHMARTSYGQGTKTMSDDRGLIRFIMRHWHTSPFEECKFDMKMPIYIARQFVGHCAASLNQVSARYSELPGEFFIPQPETARTQSSTNKQGAEGQLEGMSAADFDVRLDKQCERSHAAYQKSLAEGVPRERARMDLPLNIAAEWY